MDNLLNKLFPPKCAFCGTVGSLFCINCLSQCSILEKQFCVVCGRPAEDGKTHGWCLSDVSPTRSLSTFVYDGVVRECIKKSKYYSKEFMALKILAKEALVITRDWGLQFDEFISAPVPISKVRYLERGFNEVDLIAKIVAFTFSLDYQNSLIFRVKDTKAQHEIDKKARELNVSGAFSCKPDLVKGKKFLVVDDICTTGATLREISKVLYDGGAKEVCCYTLSKRL